MKKLLISLALISGVFAGATAQKKVLLDEKFTSAVVADGENYGPMVQGWEVSSSSTRSIPEIWCVYADGTKDDRNNVAFIDRSYQFDTQLPWSGELYTPTLDLDGSYELSYQWQSSGAAMNSNHPYDFQIRVVEEGQDLKDAEVIWDFLNPDQLLESGVQPTNYDFYSVPWVGWQWYTSKINLKPWQGKKVRVAFCYRANGAQANCIKLDNVKVEEANAPETPVAVLSRTAWNFGNVYVGAKMASDVITLTNTGTAGLNITSIEAPAGFSVISDIDLATANLKKNATAKIQVIYAPTLTSPASGVITFKGNCPDVTLAVQATKKAVPDGGLFEGFEGPTFPPAGWQNKKWRASQAGIEGEYAAAPNAYYQEENYLISPRIDASSSPATIEFRYADIYNGEEEGADTEVRLLFSKDGGNSWETVDVFNWEDTYNEIITKSYSRTANSDNCYWKFEWELTYYDSEYGAEAALFYLDAVVLNNVYGANGKPGESTPINPANNAKDVFNRGVVLQWEPAQFANGYKLYVGTDAACTSLINGQDLGAEQSFELPTLGYNTRYYWKVEPYNGRGVAENVPVWSFTTLADPTISALPWQEGFDGTFPPKGWNLYGEGSSKWSANNISPYDGTASAMANPRYDGNSCTMETPDFVLPSAAAYMTFFWGDGVAITLQTPPEGYAQNATKGSDGISDVSFEIYNDGKWERLALLSDKTNPNWIRERIDLAPYAGKRVAFRWVYTWYNFSRAVGACIDRVSIESQSGEKLSFNVDGWNIGKLNHDQAILSQDVFTIMNDGSNDATIAKVEFTNGNFMSSLKAGDKIPSGGSRSFQIQVSGNDSNAALNDAMKVTTSAGTVAEFPVSVEILGSDMRYYGFENEENGSLEVEDLAFFDMDRKNTIELAMVTYPHQGDKMAFMVINYEKNDWPNPYPNTGKQCLVTFGAYDGGTTEDWIVSPGMRATADSKFEFYARNYEHKDNLGYGEVFGAGKADVMVSTAADASNLNAYETVASYTLPYPEKDEYGQFVTDLSKYAGQKIHVAIRHSVTDGLAYFYDDLLFHHFTEFDTSGIESVENGSDDIKLVSNPVGATLEVSGVENARLTVYSTTGAKMAAGNGSSLEVSHLAPGVYVVTVATDNANKTLRFIKK